MRYPRDFHRQSIRLQGYDYSRPGGYFVTVCTRDQTTFFENNHIHKIAESYWLAIPDHFPNVELDQWVIMPNHLHGILILHESRRGVQLNAPTTPSSMLHDKPKPSSHAGNKFSKISPPKGSLSIIVRTFKASVTRECRRIGQNEFGWQRGYHDRIIRIEEELDRIRRYIEENPVKWELDPYHPAEYFEE